MISKIFGEYTLFPEIKHKFAEEIINSSKDGLEHLIILFSDKSGKLLASDTIIGKESYCDWIDPGDKGDIKVVGDFHTHPILKKIKDNPEAIKKEIGWEYENISNEAFLSVIVYKYKNIFPFSKGDMASTLVAKINRNIDRITCICCDLDMDTVPCMRINNELFNKEKGKIIQIFENILCDKIFDDIDEDEFQKALKKYFYIENIDISEDLIDLYGQNRRY